MAQRISHLAGFDDAPFRHDHRGDVLIVGVVFAGSRLEGVLSGKVRRDGVNSTATLIRLVSRCRFARHLQAVLVQGIAFAGFNVIDLHAVHEALGIPVIAVARRKPDLKAIERALLTRVRNGKRKWQLICSLPPMESVAGVQVHRVGISLPATRRLIERSALSGKLPEPLRTAHLIAGGVVTGESRHRA